MWTASSAQSSMLTTVSLAPSSTTTSTLSASVIEPSNWSTTIALLKRSARMTTWAAVASSVPVPLTVTKTGRSSSVSAGTVTASVTVASARARAEIRSHGTRPLTPLSESSSMAARSGRPRARRRDVVGRADERRVLVDAAQPLERREPPDLLAAGRHRVVVDVERSLWVQVGIDPRHLEGLCDCRHQPTAPSICSSISRLSSRAYSIGSSLAIGSTKPRTIIAIASSSAMPRDIR